MAGHGKARNAQAAGGIPYRRGPGRRPDRAATFRAWLPLLIKVASCIFIWRVVPGSILWRESRLTPVSARA